MHAGKQTISPTMGAANIDRTKVYRIGSNNSKHFKLLKIPN